MRFQNLAKFFKQYPYNTLSGKFLILDYLLLRLFPEASFSNMSIVSFVKKAYNLDSTEEFKARYYFSRIGAEELWKSRPRVDKINVGHFYQEHDMDIWRQAYYSKYNYSCKKKMLQTWHVVKSLIKKNEPILDFGCGSGVLFHYLHKRGFISVDAADIPSRTLDFISQHMRKFTSRIINLGLEQLPKNYYAAVIAVDCLEHTTEPLEITKNILESLRKGGILIIKFPKESSFNYTHIQEAQEQRDITFNLISSYCTVILPEFIYRKN